MIENIKEREMAMLEELDKLINFIQIEYIKFTIKWEQSDYYLKINLKNTLVCDILENKILLDAIINYREFINENNIQLVMDFKQFSTEKSRVNIRTKAKNSIEYKIKNYIENHENGKVSINKCFNDLFGIRIICKDVITYHEIVNLINNKYSDLKCIDSSKKDYKAIHIYFKKNNLSFQWELQVWNKVDEINNIESHEKYKQDYVKWENENKGGCNKW